MEEITSAIRDGVITFMWVFCSSIFGLFTTLIATAIGVQEHVRANPLITTFIIIIFAFIFIFEFIAEALGGARFNPTAMAAFYAAGVGDGQSVFSGRELKYKVEVVEGGVLGGILGFNAIYYLESEDPSGWYGGATVQDDEIKAELTIETLCLVIVFSFLGRT